MLTHYTSTATLFDFSKSTPYHEPLTIQGCDVEICNQLTYLGVVIDDQLSWSYHSDFVVSKCKQKRFFLRLLKSFNVNSTILYRFYTSLTGSVINYNCITWWNFLSKQKQNRVNRICNQACKVIGLPVSSPGDMYVNMSLSKVNNIIKNKDNLLHHYYMYNFIHVRSGKRLRCISSRTQRFRNSFVPNSVVIFNSV